MTFTLNFGRSTGRICRFNSCETLVEKGEATSVHQSRSWRERKSYIQSIHHDSLAYPFIQFYDLSRPASYLLRTTRLRRSLREPDSWSTTMRNYSIVTQISCAIVVAYAVTAQMILWSARESCQKRIS